MRRRTYEPLVLYCVTISGFLTLAFACGGSGGGSGNSGIAGVGGLGGLQGVGGISGVQGAEALGAENVAPLPGPAEGVPAPGGIIAITDEPEPNPPESCGCQIACDFLRDSCFYEDSGGNGADGWALNSGDDNSQKGKGNTFSAQPEPKSSLTVESAALNCRERIKVLVRFRKTSKRMSLKEVSTNQFISRSGAAGSRWGQKIVSIRNHTKTLMFRCTNQGSTAGSCHIRKITIVDDAGRDECYGGLADRHSQPLGRNSRRKKAKISKHKRLRDRRREEHEAAAHESRSWFSWLFS